MSLVEDGHQPSPKRRKTSPIHSLNPMESHTSARPASQDGRHSTPIRPSFMSPTKASLARFHPNLLPPPPPSADNKPGRSDGRRSQSIGDDQRPESNVGRKMVNGPPTALQQKAGSKGTVADTGDLVEGADLLLSGSTTGATGDGPYATPQKRLRAPLDEPLSTRQFKVNSIQDPRESPPEAVEDGEQVTRDPLNVQMSPQPQDDIPGRTNPTIDKGENEIEHAIEQEPVLPYTPTKLLLETAEPRLPSTASQLGLEAPPSPPQGLLFSSPSRRPKRKKRSDAKSSPLKPGVPSAMAEVAQTSSLGRRILVANPQPSAAKQLEGWDRSADIPARADPANSIAGISRKPSSLAQRLALFLPFSKPLIPEPDAPSAHSNLLSNSNGSTAPSALDITLTYATPPPGTVYNSNIQYQSLTLTSPQDIFIAKIKITYDTENRKNSTLAISSLSSWATPELGPWLQTEAVNLEKPTIEQTISRYWEISEVRASCWYRCEQDLRHQPATSEHAPGSSAEQQEFTQLPNKQPPAKRKSDSTASAHPSSSALLNHSSDKSHPKPPTPRQFLPQHLGQQSILFTQAPDISLLITWHLTISQSGTVHSRLSAHAAFPEPWTQAPGGEALEKVDEAFDLLVRERGVFEAVKTIWGVIFDR